MANLSTFNPTGRFSGLADLYARYRPSYPPAAIDFVVERCGLRPRSRIVDVGSGTGISSRLFAQRGLELIGVEPNVEMRRQAEAEPWPGEIPPTYREGRAEATGLPDGSADAVVAAQSFHWFDPDLALAEFHRVLKPAGWVALIRYERDETDAATAAFGAVIRSAPDASKVEKPRGKAGEALLVNPLFEAGQRALFPYQQVVDEQGFVGRAFSASYAPREPSRAAAFDAELRAVFARFQLNGQVALRYQTEVIVARRS